MSVSRNGWLRIVVVLFVLYIILAQAGAVFLPLILAIIFAFILQPLVGLFARCRLWPAKRLIPLPLAILLSFLFSAVFLTVLVAYIFMPFVGEFDQFIANLPKLIARVKQITLSLGVTAQSVDLPENVRIMIDNGLSNAAAYSLDVARRLVNAILGFAGKVVELIVVPVLVFYFLKDGRGIRDDFIIAFPPAAREKARIIIDEIGVVISGYIRGQVLVSAAMGLFVFIGMFALGVEYPLVLGLVAALTEAIPVVGPIIGAVPALLLAYLTSSVLALKVLAFYIFIHQIENNLLVPSIMKHTLDLHPVVVIVSLLFGAHIAGVVGMLLAVPMAAILKVFYKYLWYYQEG